MTFDPRHLDGHLEANGDFHAKLHGVLTLHGAQHDVVIEAQGRLDGDRLIATCHLCVAKYHLSGGGSLKEAIAVFAPAV